MNLSLRLLLALVFVGAAGAKIADPEAILSAVGHLTGRPDTHPVSVAIGVALVGWEAALGGAIALRGRDRFILAIAGATLLAFTLALTRLWFDPDAPRCGCFGASALFEKTRHETLAGIIRNGALLWVCLRLLLRGPGAGPARPDAA